MSGLPEQTVNVELMPMNQQAPSSAGPTGRLESISNMLVRRFAGSQQGRTLRLEKRPGYTPLSTTTFAAGVTAAAPTKPKLLDSWNNLLVLVGGVTPYARSEAANAWERMDGVAPYGVMRLAMKTMARRPLYGMGTKAFAPDNAAVGNVLCKVINDDTRGSQIMIVDAGGAVIKAPFAPSRTARAKVVSDGAQFWVFSQSSAETATDIQVFDTTGTQLATSSVSWGGTARPNWDIAYQPFTGKVVFVTATAATTTVVYSSYAAGVITSSTFTPTTNIPDGVALLANPTFSSNNIFISGSSGTTVKAFEISNAGAVVTSYTTFAGIAAGEAVGSITGFVKNGSFDLRVAVGALKDNTTTPSTAALNNYTFCYELVHAGGASSLGAIRSVAPVSRAFVDPDGVWRLVSYYQSRACNAVAGTVRDVSALEAQPAFFVIDMSADAPIIVGELERGFAYAFYATSRNSVVYTPWFLASAAAVTDGTLHLPLGNLGLTNAMPGGQFSASTTIVDVTISDIPGTAVATGDALIVPGMRATAFDGAQFVEQGFGLAPEIVTSVPAAGGSLTPSSTLKYVAVQAWTDAANNVYRSALSNVQTQGLGGADTQVTLTLSTDRTTIKTGSFIEIYRTFSPTLTGTTAGVILRKVGQVANDPTVDTVTFVDKLSDADASVGEECYSQVLGQSPAVARYSAPAFSSGVTGLGRAFVVGYDNAVWFSGEKVDGEGLWWNPLFRIVVPTADKLLRAIVMDTRLIMICEHSLWGVPLGNLPNANLTAGEVPTAEQVPFTTGATGPAIMTPLGAVYGAPSGIWSMDRGLESKFAGAPVLDEVSSSARPTGIAVDSSQRLHFTMSTDGLPRSGSALAETLVYDLVSGCWYKWQPPTTPAFATSWRGQYAYVDFESTQVWMEDDPKTSTYSDNGQAIISSFTIASLNFDNVNGYRCVWQMQIFGEWKGPHMLSVAVAYDDKGTVVESWLKQVGHDFDAGAERYDIMPSQIDQQSMRITVADSFAYPAIGVAALATALGGGSYRIPLATPSDTANFTVGQVISRAAGGVIGVGTATVTSIGAGSIVVQASGGFVPVAGDALYDQLDTLTPGNTFALEAIGLLVGVEQGLGRLPPTTRRIAP